MRIGRTDEQQGSKGRGRRRIAWAGAALSVMVGAAVLAVPGSGRSAVPATKAPATKAAAARPAAAPGTPVGQGQGEGPESHPASSKVKLAESPATFVVDPMVKPAVAEVAGLSEGERPRPVGRLVTGDGTASDVILSELVVGTPDDDALKALLDRRHGQVVDRLDARTTLIRIDPEAVDTSKLAADLERFEPVHRGVTKASDQATLDLLAVLASETADHGTEVAFNWVTASDDITGGRSMEGVKENPNAFGWSFIRAGGPQDIGVGPAWQLLEHKGKLSNKVRIMIDDGGFYENPDFPSWRKIRKAQWNDAHPFVYHGTNVALTAMGRLDNGYGTAGPAGPVGELVAVAHADGMWDSLKRVRDMVDQEVPHILNMSWSTDVTFAMAAARSLYDRALGDIADDGVLAFAAASNDGRDVDSEACIGKTCWETRLVYPCESSHVICVGGLAPNSSYKDLDSNYGTKTGTKTVEIYGPMRTVGLGNPRYPGTMAVNGTSFASPFVAGVAALVKAADPSLDAGQIWAIVRDTAHHDGVGLPGVIDGHRRRINALDAVAAALGVKQEAPTVAITSPADNRQVVPGQWVELTAEAVDFKGTRLPVEWKVDGVATGGPVTAPIGIEPKALGERRITATAVDLNGKSATDEVTVRVLRPPPEVRIVHPAAGDSFSPSAQIALSGESGDAASHAALPNDAVRWSVRKSSGGANLFAAKGHEAKLAAGLLPSGDYTATFVGDNGTTATATVAFKVRPATVGQSEPEPVIVTPKAGTLTSTEGRPVAVTLKGVALDDEDGSVPGTRFRWTVAGPDGKQRVVCEGSAVPGAAPAGNGPVVVVPKDCKTVTTELASGYGLQTGGVKYTIRLRVWDSAGADTTTSVSVTVQFQAL